MKWKMKNIKTTEGFNVIILCSMALEKRTFFTIFYTLLFSPSAAYQQLGLQSLQSLTLHLFLFSFFFPLSFYSSDFVLAAFRVIILVLLHRCNQFQSTTIPHSNDIGWVNYVQLYNIRNETKRHEKIKEKNNSDLFDFRLQQCILMFRVAAAAGVSFYRWVPFAISYFILAWVCNINLFETVERAGGRHQVGRKTKKKNTNEQKRTQNIKQKQNESGTKCTRWECLLIYYWRCAICLVSPFHLNLFKLWYCAGQWNASTRTKNAITWYWMIVNTHTEKKKRKQKHWMKQHVVCHRHDAFDRDKSMNISVERNKIQTETFTVTKCIFSAFCVCLVIFSFRSTSKMTISNTKY